MVLIWEGRLYGWKDELQHPEHERSGVIAFDLEGGLYETEGGNDQDGLVNGLQWTQILRGSSSPAQEPDRAYGRV